MSTSHRARRLANIVIHNSNTSAYLSRKAIAELPYNIAITHNGNLVHICPRDKESNCLHIALIGRPDTQWPKEQMDTLFDTLVGLIVRHPHAMIDQADKLQNYPYPNPGFDMADWLASYIPGFLNAQ